MSNMLDFNLLPLSRQAGEYHPELPGLQVARRPRRAARGREQDQLILFLAFGGSEPAVQIDRITAEAANTYYDTPGAVTSALRFTAEAINHALLQQNQKGSGSGQQTLGLLSLVVLRGGQLYLAQSGPVHAYFLSGGQVEHLYDVQLTGKGLGLSQGTQLRYFQAVLNPNDTLLLATIPDPSWSAAGLAPLYGQGPESLRRRLLGQSGADVQAVILQAAQGSGKVVLLTASPIVHVQAPTAPAAPSPATMEAAISQSSMMPAEALAPDEPEVLLEEGLPDGFLPLAEPEILGMPEPLASRVVAEAPVVKGHPRQPEKRVAALHASRQGTGDTLAGATHNVGRAGGTLFSRLLPEDAWAAIPNSVMAFIALAVPLVIVAIATGVYFRRGLAAQAEYLYSQAVEVVSQAQVQTDLLKRRESLIIALDYLDRADSLNKIPGSAELRPSVGQALDDLDQVKRLDFQPAVTGGVGDMARITRMLAVDGDLYMLDGRSGKVFRATPTQQGYQIDETIQCGPGAAAGIGSLVDLAAWPNMSDIQASVVAMDANGNLALCAPDTPAQVAELGNPANRELTNLVGFSQDFTDLYVLDPQGSAVWVYLAGQYSSEPRFYFDQDIPVTIQGMIDLEATSENLYLLHKDGHMVVCYTGTLGNVTPSRCTDPVPFMDTRVGRENTPIAHMPPYSQFEYSPPPDPSLYFLEPTTQAIDRYSLHVLAFQKRFQPESALPGGEATAFFIDSINRMIFLAVGNQVYYAAMP
jgi:hypothetical protein